MVRRSHELEDLEAEAEVPYEDTRLARAAPRSRARLMWLLLAGAALALAAAAYARAPGWVLAALAAAGAAWGTRKGKLGGLVAAGFLALLALFVPLRWLLVEHEAAPALVLLSLAVVLGAASLPDVVLLIRDAELQHAYGRWARRDR